MTPDQSANQIAPAPRPGERVQTWWCKGCEAWHTGSELGGLVKDDGEENASNGT